MLCATVSLNSTTSCPTNAIWLRRFSSVKSRISLPSSVIEPSVTSYSRGSRLSKVDLPLPDLPTNATVSPALMSRSISVSVASRAEG